MSEWREVTLDMLGSVERGRSRHRPRNDGKPFGGDMPFFQTGDIKAATLHVTRATQFYSDFGVRQSRVWPVGTTCITIAANIGETAVLGRQGCFPDSVLGFTPTHSIDAYFVKYLLDIYRDELASKAQGTTQGNLSLEKLLTHRFRVPDLPVRTRIASILISMDELIENNGRRIDLLGQMTQAMYREWFVRFSHPCVDGTRLVNSSLGPIPEGWAVRPLGEVADITMGQSPPSAYYNTSGVGKPFHQGVTDFGRHFPTDRKFCSVEGRRARDSDILISVRAPVGRINLATGDLLVGRGLAAVRSRDREQAFLYQSLRLRAFAEENSMGTGTIYRAINKDDLAGVSIIYPPTTISTRANSVFEEYLTLIRTLTFESRTVAAVRDLLLPKLVTGQIDLSAVDLDAAQESVP